ncbi:MAG: hypothetical protein JW891_03135 [Candidatus Lokiarchaeota archaeon]|nr:hypothetical protein [Candidatus Lokiarchaeota archaeon]
MFREINPVEDKIIHNSLSLITPKIPKDLKNIRYEKWIYLGTTRYKQFFPKIFMVPNELISFLQKRIFNPHLQYAGIFFGTIKRGEFLLSLEGAEFLLQIGSFPESQIIIVNESGEKGTLYRNKITNKMIRKISQDLSMQTIVLVQNQDREVLSLARCEYDKARDIINPKLNLITLIDKGYYLRTEQ